MDEKVAFVAMKFTTDSWRDKRYQVIREVLEEAGYKAIRADEIRTSGPSTEEVCRYLRSASLVVIDSTGDSHNVSYEIGYCHGIQRPYHNTILIREESSIPFNYRHYRHRTYKDLRHLRRLLREVLDISTPLRDDQLGCVVNFNILPEANLYGEVAANAIVSALKYVKFSGRCEYYAADGLMMGMPSAYIVGIGLKQVQKNLKVDYAYWEKFLEKVAEFTANTRELVVDEMASEVAEMSGIRGQLLNRGVVQFQAGEPVFILNVVKESWFISLVNSRMKQIDG